MKSSINTVSVIIPAYNSENYIAEAIDSVLSQSFPVHELIVVNDGSSDATAHIAKSYGDRVIVIDRNNGGVTAARNLGAQRATGKWLVFLDADDVMVSTALQHLINISDDHRYGVAYGAIMEFDEKSRKQWPRGGSNSQGLPPIPAKANFPRAMIVAPGAAMIRAELHHKIGGFEKPWQPTEDRDYWMKLGAITGFRYCSEVVLKKRSHEAQSTKKYAQTLNWGMMVQLEYLTWLDNQGIDKDFLKTNPKLIAHNAIRKAVKKRQWYAIELILETLEKNEISSPFILLARLVYSFKKSVT